MQDAPPITSVNLLMYHSISAAPGPTSISAAIFAEQLDVLADCGYTAVSLGDFADWHQGSGELPPHPVVITFDDGFADFAEQAFPALEKHGWSATVFLPSGCLGGRENWDGADPEPRALMSWQQVRDLARAGIDFGSHSIDHSDLTRLTSDALEKQLIRSRQEIGEQLGTAPNTFAPPYGRSNPAVRAAIARHYGVSVGTQLARAGRASDLYDLPRIEMHYFRESQRWRRYLEGRGEGYLLARQTLRRVRQQVPFL